jgi:ABC-type polysaccharide/polyol phosphate export permease
MATETKQVNRHAATDAGAGHSVLVLVKSRRPEKVERTIEAGAHGSIAQSARELWLCREIVLAFAERHIRAKYKQAILGVGWAVIQPLAFLAVFNLVFARLPLLSTGKTSYAASALSALVPWTFLQTAITFGTQAIVTEGALIRKVYFLRETPVLGAVLGTSLDCAIGLALYLTLSPFMGVGAAWTALLTVPLWFVLASLAFGLSLLFGALNVYFRDVRYLIILFLQVWMFGSPVAYPLTAVPARWRNLYLVVNPAAGLLEAFRQVLVNHRLPEFGTTVPGIVGTAAVLWFGYRTFKRLEPGFADAL